MMRRLCCFLLIFMSLLISAQADLTAIDVAYTFPPPSQAEYTACTWQLTLEKPSSGKAAEALAYFAPGVRADLEREYLRGNLLFYRGNNPVSLSTKAYRSPLVAPIDPQDPLLVHLGWTNVCEMTALRADEAYALWCVSGMHAQWSRDEYLLYSGYEQDAMAEVHVLWQLLDGRPVYPDTISDIEPVPVHAVLARNGDGAYISGQFGNRILSAEPVEPIIAAISPESAAEQVAQHFVESWQGIRGITGTVRITADQVMQGYWIDDSAIAHPGWLVHIWSIQSNDAGERVFVGDYWRVVDFITGGT